jgi:chromosome segregation ATPase
MKKLDIKSILIIFFLLTTLFFGYRWFFGRNSASEERVKQLDAQFKELEKQKAENEKQILFWRKRFDSLQVDEERLKLELEKLTEKTRVAELEAEKSKGKLDKLRKEIMETRKKIEDFKKSPPVKTEEELLQSLKNKTK